VVEGPGLVAEALAGGWHVEAQFVAPGADPVPGAGAPVYELAPGVLERVATTENPQPVIAIVRQRPATWESVSNATFVVIGDRISDPGNLGTIIRVAEASGADAVALTAGSVDPTNPKVVRSSAGALFHVPVIIGATLADARAAGLRVVGTSSHLGSAHTATDLGSPVALVLGNEAHGLPDDADVDAWVTIPHRGRAESLNVAMAAAVLCFEVARQRETL
jgi:TrmH family RNA methyltransferase